MATSDNGSLAISGHRPQIDTHPILQHGSPPPAQRHVSDSSTASSDEAAMRKQRSSQSRPITQSSSSNNTQASGSTRAENRAAQRLVRSIPPWVESFEEDEEIRNSKPTDRLLSSPPRAHSAQHHHTPANPVRRVSQDGFVEAYDEGKHGGINGKKPETGFFGGHREPVKGRKWDHARDAEPVIVQSGVPALSPWAAFIKSSMYAHSPNEDHELKTEEDLNKQAPGYFRPWRGDLEAGDDSEKFSGLLHNKKKRKNLIRRAQHSLLMHPLVPLIFRLCVLSTSVIALSISSSVHHLSNKYTYAQNPSTTMAIVVDVVAIPYILYITWDEYTGKPLGLRSPKAKMRLVLLDLFFIIFESANLALAFGALTDSDGSCQVGTQNGENAIICDRVKALCGILMGALIAWSLTFTVSIFRLVERVGGREEGD